MSRIIQIAAFVFTFFFIPLFRVEAAGGYFRADYDVQYDVAPGGKTIVTQTVQLTNKETNLYPKQYSIDIDTDQIRNVVARDPSGQITPQITQSDGKTHILLTFGTQVVGLGKTLSFTLRYEDLLIAQKNGRIWEVNIPGVSPDPDLGDYRVGLTVPPAFGDAAYVSPLPADGTHWDKAQMLTGGISAAYGTSQVFSVGLSYYLANSNVTPGYTEIALPPDTEYQHVFISAINPKPSNVREDRDGNWLARYDLSGGQKLNVSVSALVAVSPTPRAGYHQKRGDPSLYTGPDEYWESGDQEIAAAARSLHTPRAIYDYVVKTLSYDYARVNGQPIRKGAAEALKTPDQSVCMEFTDLFVALSRAAGIPAREVVGYAYTTNTKLRPLSLVADVLHSWPEYYDTGASRWIAVDPTWGKTTGGVDYFDKMDFDHIALAVHGVSSTLPYPAGFYRKPGSSGKDLDVSFTDRDLPVFSPGNLSAAVSFPSWVLSGTVAEGLVTIQNVSGLAAGNIAYSIQTEPHVFSASDTITRVPPLSELSVPITIRAPQILTIGRGRISVSVSGGEVNAYYTVEPVVILLIPIGFAVSMAIIAVWILFRKKT
ncbi:transglutaminase-like domain-containing protein [Patescibacteria group bacterium]|nr:transglutaminase-like domain-containing protein [Patescibacteria group bacterium]